MSTSNGPSKGPPIAGSGSSSTGSGQRPIEGKHRRHRGGNRGGRPNTNQDESHPKRAGQKFVGKEEGLGDEFVYVLTSGNEASDQYARTTEEIIRYSSTKYKQGGDVERSLSDGAKLAIPIPTAPQGTPPPESEVQVWKLRVSMALQRDALLDSNLESAYALIKGQCSKPILEKVEAQADYVTVHRDRDPIGLLQLIKSVMFRFNSRKYRAVAIIELIGPGND